MNRGPPIKREAHFKEQYGASIKDVRPTPPGQGSEKPDKTGREGGGGSRESGRPNMKNM